MKYVQAIRGPGGETYLYLRKAGLPRCPLSSPLPALGQENGSDLEREVQSLIANLTAAKPLPSTLGEALRAYELEDADFRSLRDSTKYEYRLILKEFEETMGRVRIVAFTAAFVLELRDAWAKRGHRCANVRRQVLKNVLKRSLIGDQLDKDPFALVGQARRPDMANEAHVLWPDAVVEIVIIEAIKLKRYGLARAIALARYTGARRGDLVRLTPAARAGGRFRYLSGKRRVQVDVPEDPRLKAWLHKIPAEHPSAPRKGRKLPAGVAQAPPTTLVFTVTNGRYSPHGLNHELRKLVTALQAREAIPTDAFGFHGLRHTRGVEAALAGCTDPEGAAMLGHSNAVSFAQYRRQASRFQLADSGSAKVQNMRRTASVKRPVKKV